MRRHTWAPSARRPRRVSRVAMAALGTAVIAGLLLALSGPGTRAGFWDFRTGFTLLRWGAYLGLASAALGLAALVLTRPGAGRRGMPFAALALLGGLIAAAIPWQWQRTARAAPPIHDITTDTENPPEFVSVLPLRANAPNPAAYAGSEVADQQRAAYPDVRPLRLSVSREEAFEAALASARGMGWEIVDVDAEAGRIEATATTRWFGFRDDVVVRVRPEARVVRVDVRSVSRVGRGDAGENARRIRRYLARLERQANR
jgi:uncharacterized protein (DUF1499 family)